MIIELGTQFLVYLPWGQRPFSKIPRRGLLRDCTTSPINRFAALIFTFSCRSFQTLDIAGEPREADGAAARPGGLRQPGLRRPRVRAGGLSAEAVSEGLPTKNVLPGKLILFPHPSLTSTSPPQFSDMLLYANRAAGPGLQFRVHGQLTVSDVQVRPQT